MADNSRVTIGIVGQLPPPHHGSAVMTQRLAQAISDIGYEARVVSRDFSSSADEVGQFKLQKLRRAIGLMREVGALGSTRACVVFGTNRRGSFLIDCVILAILRKKRVRTINYIHTQGYKQLAESSRTLAKLVKWFLAQPELNIVLSPRLAQDIRPWVEERRIAIIPNCVAPSNGDIELDDQDASCTREVLFLSNLLPEKGALAFVQSAAYIGPEVKVRLTVAGDTEELSYKARLYGAARSHPVSFVGSVYGAEKDSLMRRSHLFVFPTTYRYEAQPLVILEALAAGLPVISSDAGGIPDIIEDGVNGRILSDVGPEEIARAILDVLQDSGKLNVMRQSAKRSAVDRYSFAAYVKNWRRVLTSLVGEP